MNKTNAINHAVFLVGGQSSLARKIGVTPQAVQRWCKTGNVPTERVIAVEEATEGQIKRTELRPDIYPA